MIKVEHALHLLFLVVVFFNVAELYVDMTCCYVVHKGHFCHPYPIFLINTLHFKSKMIYAFFYLLFACLNWANTKYQMSYFLNRSTRCGCYTVFFCFALIFVFFFHLATRKFVPFHGHYTYFFL